jgi:hypothetical protein
VQKTFGAEIAKALEDRRQAIESAITTRQVLNILDSQATSPLHYVPLDYDEHFKPAYLKAIELAITLSDAWAVFTDESLGDAEEEATFDKLLSLAENKEDVEIILDSFKDWMEITLDTEKFLVKIFNRARELPDRDPLDPN